KGTQALLYQRTYICRGKAAGVCWLCAERSWSSGSQYCGWSLYALQHWQLCL
ncbi:hypothetical protein GGI05_007723, partial [Coemansia sp. RSA 2603]